MQAEGQVVTEQGGQGPPSQEAEEEVLTGGEQRLPGADTLQ